MIDFTGDRSVCAGKDRFVPYFLFPVALVSSHYEDISFGICCAKHIYQYTILSLTLWCKAHALLMFRAIVLIEMAL